MKVMDGRVAAAAMSEKLKSEVEQLISKGERVPHLVAILVGNNPASETYVANKEKKCHELGFKSTIIRHESTISEKDLLDQIEKINKDDEIDGLIVQLPLPKHIDEDRVTAAIIPEKDVDGFHPMNLGRLMLGQPCYAPATPFGVIELLRHYEIPTKGKNVVVLGRSHIVGLPVANMLLQKHYPGDSTVTVCHSRTENLAEKLREADILIVAIGVADFVKADMVKEGAVVIDVGINRVDDPSHKRGWALHGDVDYKEVAPKCSYITPVPGGCGPMTIISLMYNTMLSRKGEVKMKL